MIKVIKLDDGLEIEVEVDDDQPMEISNHRGAVSSSINDIQSLLTKVMQPISNTYKELDKNMSIDAAKVTVGVKVGVEGNFILAKSSVGAHIQVEMTLRASDA